MSSLWETFERFLAYSFTEVGEMVLFTIESCGSLIPFDRCWCYLFNIWLLLYLPLLFLIDLIDLGWYVFIVKFLCKGFNYVIYFCSPDDILLIILLIILLLLNIYVSRQVKISWVRFHLCLKKKVEHWDFLLFAPGTLRHPDDFHRVVKFHLNAKYKAPALPAVKMSSLLFLVQM